MRIGIDCRTILNPGFGEKAGIGHYTYYLINALLNLDKKNEYVLFFDELISRESAQRIIGENKKARAEFFPFHEYRHYLLPEYSKNLINAFIGKERLDLLFLPSPVLYTGCPIKTVVVIHDLAIFRHPEWFEKIELADRENVKEAAARAAKIITVSEFTKKEAIKILKVPQEKIKVIYHGVDTTRHFLLTEDIISADDCVDKEDLEKKYGLNKDYILFIGSINPRKNIINIIKGFEILREKDLKIRENIMLAVAGFPGAQSEEILQEIKKSEKTSGGMIKYLGYIPYNDKYALVKYASCFVFPSFYEGFGLPVLEAMDIGTPVVSSDVSAIPEVAGRAGFLVDPGKPKEIAEALFKLISDGNLHGAFSKEGVKRARLFSWDKTAKETLDLFKRL